MASAVAVSHPSSGSIPVPDLQSELNHQSTAPTPSTSEFPNRLAQNIGTAAQLPSSLSQPEAPKPFPSIPLQSILSGNNELDSKPPIIRHATNGDLAFITPTVTESSLYSITGRKKSHNDVAITPATSNLATGNHTPAREGLLKRGISFFKKRTDKSPNRGQTTTATANGSTNLSTNPNANNSPMMGHTLKKLASFSRDSASPTVSSAGTPPSPRSRESTFCSQEEDESAFDDQMTPRPINSSSDNALSNSISAMATPTSKRPGITWGINRDEEGEVDMTRRRGRSVSQDRHDFQRRLQPERATDAVGDLMAAFSFRSAEGVGLKARRLSTSLPDQFTVDYCDLESEYKNSSHIPGKRGHTIGKGATATVKLMLKKHDPTHTFYAVKEFRRMDKSESEDEYVKKVKSEFSIAQSLHHPNIVTTVRLCQSHGRWNHVMEYCKYGEMYHWVEKGLFRKNFSSEDRLCLFKQLIRGVDYLHSHGIAHRDIKLENLLLTSEGYLKITDFGVSDVFSGEHPGLRSAHGKCGQKMGSIRKCAPGICGSLPYIAPEVLEKGIEYDPRPLDVWSCAVVLLTMTFQGSPWTQAKDNDERFKRFKSGWDTWLSRHPDGAITEETGIPALGPLFSTELLGNLALKKLLTYMLHPIPEKRMTIREVLNSPYVKHIECCAPDVEVPDEGMAECCARLKAKKVIQRKHNHIPPKEHWTPEIFRHRFDMGNGYH